MTIYRHGPLGKTGRASEDFGPGSPQCAVTIAHAGLQRFGRLLRWRGIFVSAAVRDHAYRIHEGKAGASHSDPIDPCADSVIQSAGHATTTAVIFIFDQGHQGHTGFDSADSAMPPLETKDKGTQRAT
jgi:hypothetical protein